MVWGGIYFVLFHYTPVLCSRNPEESKGKNRFPIRGRSGEVSAYLCKLQWTEGVLLAVSFLRNYKGGYTPA